MEPTRDDEWISLPVRPGVMEVQTADGALVARVFGATPDEAEANADRIVAAINALRGVPTEAIEAAANQPTDEARMNALARVPFVEANP
jgi:hypothetical protein